MRYLPAAAIGMVIAAAVVSCARDPKKALEIAENSIGTDSLMTEIRALASDEFEGRKPGTPGEEKTVAYLQQQFQQLGLKPGNPNGTWIQKVPLAGTTSLTESTISVKGAKLPAVYKKDYIAISRRYVPDIEVKDSDIVFVGYGVVAPEYGWDDYKGLDVKGKTIVMLINDPQIPEPANDRILDDKMFRGRAMTYYGRWTYKYEIASEKGAAAAILVHETPMAGYPWEVVASSWTGENFDVIHPDHYMSRVAVEGWMTWDKTSELFHMAGLDLAALKKEALKKEFRPVPLPGAKAAFRIQNTLREIDSKNVVAKLEGADPAHKDEYVIYTAHWDHFGKDTALPGDQIFNGARDNASGTAGLIEIARAYTKLPNPPKRSILFLSVTAEEQGLLGTEYYAENPLYPLKKTLADINMDELNVWGVTKDMVVVGLGSSTLDDTITGILKEKGRTVTGDAEPQKGFYYRSDHFEFAKQGVPALDPEGGVNFIGKSPTFGQEKREAYDANDYHKPSDEPKPDWDLTGATQDLRVLLETGFQVANGDVYPEWKPGTEFKAKRDSMMKQ